MPNRHNQAHKIGLEYFPSDYEKWDVVDDNGKKVAEPKARRINRKKNQIQCGVELADYTVAGKKIDWGARKLAVDYLALAYDQINARTAKRLRRCASRLSFGCLRESDSVVRKKLIAADFCRVRLCPMCQWRRSLKLFAQMMRVMEFLEPEGYQYIFLTLTVKNCKLENLSSTIDQMQEGFHQLMKYKEVSGAVEGWYRGLEVTHNLEWGSESYDTFHPHYHVVMAVKKSYFSGKYYVKQERWGELWQRALGFDYVPMVDIRKVKGVTAKAVAESTKYAAKSKDYIIFDDWDLTVTTVRGLDDALHGRQLIGFGGCLREARRKLMLDDVEDGDLVQTDVDKPTEEFDYFESYGWHVGFNQYRMEVTAA